MGPYYTKLDKSEELMERYFHYSKIIYEYKKLHQIKVELHHSKMIEKVAEDQHIRHILKVGRPEKR